MSEPTPLDQENAARRAEIAERQNAAYREAQLLAVAALGPDWKPWMALHLIPADHRRTGDGEPVATVIKAYRGEEKLSENSRFVRRMPDGSLRTSDNYEALFGDLLAEKHPTLTVEVRGAQVPVGRYELCWSSLELYHPKSADQLSALRESRERGQTERSAADNPLFADQIRAGEWKPEKKPRGR